MSRLSSARSESWMAVNLFPSWDSWRTVDPTDAFPPKAGLRSILAALAGIVLTAAPTVAAPQITWFFPNGIQRGTTAEISVHGSGLSQLTGAFFTNPGLVAEVLPVAPSHVPAGAPAPKDTSAADSTRTLRITTARDAPLGIGELRVYDPDGLSNRLGFQVGQWPEMNETEPNETPETANLVTLPVTINGKIQQGGDQDCYRFMAKAGQQISCEITAERLLSWIGDSWLKGFLEVLDPHGNSIAESSGRFHWDDVINFTAPEDGQYVVRFRDLNYRGSPLAVYRLTIGAVPYVASVFPPGGRQGEKVHLAFTGVNLGKQPDESISIPASGWDSGHDVRFTTPEGESNPVPFQTGRFPEVVETEPNDAPSQANPVTVPITINGRMDHENDLDCFRFHADAKQRLIFEVYAYRAGSLMDPFLTLRDMQGKRLTENDDAKDRDSLIDYTFPAAGDYMIEVRDTDLQFGPEVPYRLSIGAPRPDFSLIASPDRIAVPAGGAARVDVKVDRQWGFDSPIQLRVDGLPAGITASQATIPAGSDHTSLTIQAPPAGSGAIPFVIRVVGSATKDSQAFTHTAASTETYNLQGTAYQRPVVGPVTLIADPGPFTFSASTDHLSLQAGGQASLALRIRRGAGVKGPVKIASDGLPPGVTAEPLTIPDGSDSGTLLLKAAEDASAGEAPLILTGTLDAANSDPGLAPAVSLVVQETPGFFVSLAADNLTVPKGKSATLKVLLKRRGRFDGPVDLAVTGLPAGVTADSVQIPAGGGEADITLRAAAGAAAAAGVEIHVEGVGVIGGEKRTRSAGTAKLTLQ